MKKLFQALLVGCFVFFNSFALYAATISAGNRHAVLLGIDGKVWTFGLGNQGQLGHTNNQNSNIPIKIDTLNENIIDVSAGGSHTVLRNNQGEVWVFGKGEYGQLGLGNNENKLFAIKIDTLIPIIIAQSAGDNHTVLLDTNGEVWTFGLGNQGQLGLLSTQNENIPTKIALDKKIVAISAGGTHSVVLDNNADVWTFGDAHRGQLGHSNYDQKNIPTKIEKLKNIIAISAGASHTVVLNNKGRVFTFGYGVCGRLGQGNEESKNTPTKIKKLKNITAISAGYNHTVLLDSEGAVWTFGLGNKGQLGHGNFQSKIIPTKITGFKKNIVAISAGNNYTVLLDKKGTVWIFGHIPFGQCIASPTKIENIPLITLPAKKVQPTKNARSILLHEYQNDIL